MRFQRRGGSKRIVAPDGSTIVPTNKPQPDGTLVKALARAWRWQRLLDEGVHASITEIAEAELIGREVRTSRSTVIVARGHPHDGSWSIPASGSSSPAIDWVTISCSA